MNRIDTVRGPVEVSALGQTLAHEHVVSISTEFARFYPELAWAGDRAAVIRHAVAELQKARELGITTIIDATANMHDRDLDIVREVNDQVDLNIVVSTGIYTYDHLPPHISYRKPASVADDILFRMFLRDITVGVADSGVRAMSIKIAVDHPGFTPNIVRVFRAAGKASAETGAPITVHSDPRRDQAIRALEILTEQGADPSTVVIGHSGDTADLEYLRGIVDAGAVIGDDRFGLYLAGCASEDERIEVLRTLTGEGKADRIVLGHDSVLFSDWGEPREGLAPAPGRESWVPSWISSRIVPELLARGIAQADVDAMLVSAPASLFKNIAC